MFINTIEVNGPSSIHFIMTNQNKVNQFVIMGILEFEKRG